MIAVGDGTRELQWLTMVLATLLVVPALARPAARVWAIVFVAALAFGWPVDAAGAAARAAMVG